MPMDQSVFHPNEVGSKDIPWLHIAICPDGHTMTYGPMDGPPHPGRCMGCGHLMITMLIPLSLLSRYSDLTKHFYPKVDSDFSVVEEQSKILE